MARTAEAPNVFAVIDSAIRMYCTAISIKYKINEGYLHQLFILSTQPSVLPKEPVKMAPKEKVAAKKINPDTFAHAGAVLARQAMPTTLQGLKDMCKRKGLKVSGTKAELISRIENPNAAGSRSSRKQVFKPTNISKIMDKLKGGTSSLAIRKNDAGLYVHIESGLVFNPQNERVYAKLVNGVIQALTKKDLEHCLALGVAFEIPENMSTTKIVDDTLDEELGISDDELNDDENSDEEFDADEDADEDADVDED